MTNSLETFISNSSPDVVFKWIDTVSDCLQSVLIRSIEIRDKIVNNAVMFANQTLLPPNDTMKSELIEYICSMVLFLWTQKNYQIDSILRGLHKQSITSLHIYFCPDLKPIDPTTSIQTEDPFRDATVELQKLSDAKPQTCPFCRTKAIFAYTSVQTRSADEGMTSFATCGNCGKRTRQ